MHAAIDLGIGEGALQASLPFIREQARPWIDARIDKASEDPLSLQALGDVDVRLHAARALLRRRAAITDAAQANPTEASVAAASVAVAQARTLCHSAGLLAANKLLELGGTSATFAAWGGSLLAQSAHPHLARPGALEMACDWQLHS